PYCAPVTAELGNCLAPLAQSPGGASQRKPPTTPESLVKKPPKSTNHIDRPDGANLRSSGPRNPPVLRFRQPPGCFLLCAKTFWTVPTYAPDVVVSTFNRRT